MYFLDMVSNLLFDVDTAIIQSDLLTNETLQENLGQHRIDC